MIETITNIIWQATNEQAKVTIPEDAKFGHFSTNFAMIRAGQKNTNPREEAEQIRADIMKLAPQGFFEKIDIAGPGFINFFLSQKTIATELKKIIAKKDKYGSSKAGEGKTIIIDYSAPNIAKPMSVGHLRSTVIGSALVSLLRFQGYKVIGDNHLGDWGTQFGTLIAAYKRWFNDAEFKKNPIEHLVSLYIRFHKEASADESLMDIAKAETARLQKGDKENIKLWKLFVKKSQVEFNKLYKRLGVNFELTLGESFYQPMLGGVVQDALRKEVAEVNDGAVKIFFKNDNLPPYVIEKSDGSHLYTTTDLATIKYRVSQWKPVKILYVVANEQALHFAQLFEAARMLNIAPGTELIHIKFGMMLGISGKKFSTRRGEFIKLDDLLNKANEVAANINPDSAEKVGIGAVKYYDLSHHRLSDIIFDWDKMLNLKGNSAPYLQYTVLRLKNVIKKSKGISPNLNIKLLTNEAEKRVVDSLIRFPDVVAYAAEKYDPSHLADYLFKTAHALSAFYETSPVIRAESKVAESRIALVIAGNTVLQNGLNLLGIEVPSKM